MKRHHQSQAPGLLLLAVWIAALLCALWLGGCIQQRPSEPGRPASVSAAQNVWRSIGFPVLEAGVLFALDWLRPRDEALVAEPQEEY